MQHFPEFCELIYQLSNLKGNRNSHFAASSLEVWVASELWKLMYEVRIVFWKTVPLTYGISPISKELA